MHHARGRSGEAVLERECRGGAPGGHPELREDVLHVAGDRVLADHELGGDLAVGSSRMRPDEAARPRGRSARREARRSPRAGPRERRRRRRRRGVRRHAGPPRVPSVRRPRLRRPAGRFPDPSGPGRPRRGGGSPAMSRSPAGGRRQLPPGRPPRASAGRALPQPLRPPPGSGTPGRSPPAPPSPPTRRRGRARRSPPPRARTAAWPAGNGSPTRCSRPGGARAVRLRPCPGPAARAPARAAGRIRARAPGRTPVPRQAGHPRAAGSRPRRRRPSPR